MRTPFLDSVFLRLSFFFQTALATCLSRAVWLCGVSATTLPLTLSLLIAFGCEVLTLANRRTSWRTARELFLRVASRRIYHVAVRLFFLSVVLAHLER